MNVAASLSHYAGHPVVASYSLDGPFEVVFVVVVQDVSSHYLGS